MFVNVGFADTDMRIGVEEPFWIATFEMTGFETPKMARPWLPSLKIEFVTGIETFVISTIPWVAELVPKRSRQRETEPVEPALKTTRFQSPRLGAVMEPLLLVSSGVPNVSSCIEVMVMVSPTAAVPFMRSSPFTVMTPPPMGLMTTPGWIVRVAPTLMVSEPSST